MEQNGLRGQKKVVGWTIGWKIVYIPFDSWVCEVNELVVGKLEAPVLRSGVEPETFCAV